jgi:hypothetical protein
MEVATNVAWITCIATATFAMGVLASLITYYEPRHEALCHVYFRQLINRTEVIDKEAVQRELIKGLKDYRLQFSTIPDLLTALRVSRGVVSGFLVASALLLLVAIALSSMSKTSLLANASEINTTVTWFSTISLVNTFLCVIWVILNTARLEIRYALRDALLLDEIKNAYRTVDTDVEIPIQEPNDQGNTPD